jgi:hypothetical protein
MAAKTFDEFWDEVGIYNLINRTGCEAIWKAAIKSVAAHSTSDNTSMDAIAQITDILDNRDDLDSECKITLINIIIGKQHHR